MHEPQVSGGFSESAMRHSAKKDVLHGSKKSTKQTKFKPH